MNFSEIIESFLLLIRNPFAKKAEEIFEINNARFVVLDTETTGFDYNKDRILCIGAIVLQNNSISIQDSFEVYIEQEYYNQSTAQIHGILREIVLQRPKEEEALQQFLAFLGDSIIIAHHAKFDITMINNALERNGLSKITNKTIDTAELYKKSLINSPLFRTQRPLFTRRPS